MQLHLLDVQRFGDGGRQLKVEALAIGERDLGVGLYGKSFEHPSVAVSRAACELNCPGLAGVAAALRVVRAEFEELALLAGRALPDENVELVVPDVGLGSAGIGIEIEVAV